MKKILVPAIFFSFGLIFLAFNYQFSSNKTEKNFPQGSGNFSVSNYSFSQSSGSYNSISSGIVLTTRNSYDSTFGNIPIGFTFNYNGTDYSVVGISDNGWIQPGAASPPGHYTYPMICSTYVSPVVCAFNADLLGNITDTLRYITTGSAPNRIFTIEWCHFGFQPYGNNEMNFELKLFETSNLVQFVYQPLTTTYTTTIQVGLMGQSGSDYFTRTETTSWASTTVGTACAYCYYSSYVIPFNGLTFTFTPGPSGIIPNGQDIPKGFKLYDNYPNPFNPDTKIKFDIPPVNTSAVKVRLVIYDILGRIIATLVNEELKPGSYEYKWNSSNFSSGIYYYRIEAGEVSGSSTSDFLQVKKMVLLK